MTREIKFRAWDLETGKWCTHNDFLGDSGNPIKVNASVKTPSILEFGRDDLILMQFTGLKDKDYKEIYEGDLLKAIPNGMEPRSILEVFWDETIAAFYVRIKNKLDGSVTWNDLLEGFTKEYTVIGNIYENPGLLK